MSRHYVLVHNHMEGMALHHFLDEAGLPNRISPTPRCKDLRVACGMALLIPEPAFSAVKEYIAAHKVSHAGFLDLEDDLNPYRDQYC